MVIFAGIYSTTKMKLETMPNISIPYLFIATPYPGAAPEQISDEVSVPLEKKVRGIEGVKNVYSTAYSNMSSVQIEFNYGVDMDKKEQEVKKIVDDMKFNENVQDSAVMAMNMNSMPVVAMSVSSKDMNKAALTNYVEKHVQSEFDTIDGVADVSVSGAYSEKYVMTYDEAKLKAFKLDKDTVEKIIKATDLKMPLGLYAFNDSEQSIVVDGKVNTIAEFKKIKLPAVNVDGKPLTVGDIAAIQLKGNLESVSRTNGEDSITLSVVKSQSANTVDVVNAVKDKMEEIQKANKDLHFNLVLDQGDPIEKSVHTMLNKAIFGAIFAVIIILLFLRNVRSTLISLVSIPMSILISMIILKQIDITLNIMTLGAVTVAIGRVIDDSIVVVENIFRKMHLKEKKTTYEIIKEATVEMFIPILSSTLVTIAVFLPLGLVSGMVGELFLPFALTMGFALIASLVVAITIVPVMAHYVI